MDEETSMPALKSKEQQSLLLVTFPKHIREIFGDLQDFIADNDFKFFMDCLLDNIKNLAVRLHLLDKKLEKQLIGKIGQNLSET